MQDQPNHVDQVSEEEKKKQEWARQMRVKFSPPEMLNPDGSLNHEYFKPSKHMRIKVKKWGDKEKKLLIRGIEVHGVGSWQLIQRDFLPDWEVNELRIKCATLMGRQSLVLYKGWKGTEADILRERERNHAIGMELGCWKGVLVADEEGKVAQRIAETEPKR